MYRIVRIVKLGKFSAAWESAEQIVARHVSTALLVVRTRLCPHDDPEGARRRQASAHQASRQAHLEPGHVGALLAQTLCAVLFVAHAHPVARTHKVRDGGLQRWPLREGPGREPGHRPGVALNVRVNHLQSSCNTVSCNLLSGGKRMREDKTPRFASIQALINRREPRARGRPF